MTKEELQRLAMEGAKARLLAIDVERSKLMAFLGASTPRVAASVARMSPKKRTWSDAQRAKHARTMRLKAAR